MTEPTVHNNNELIMKSITEKINESVERINQPLTIFDMLKLAMEANNLAETNLEQSTLIPKIIEISSEQNIIDNNSNSASFRKRKGPNTKEEERRRQMAKNREYARKCVQKKKDQRNEAADRSDKLFDQIETLQKNTAAKERNANFAVELLKSTDREMAEAKRKYEERKALVIENMEKEEAADDTVNINYGRLEDAKEEFKKAAEDLKVKNGVIGTLGSRKIRAKQHMEWRMHLYNISVREHALNREKALAQLVDEYMLQTVPRAAPLVKTIPKQLLDELIRCKQTTELEEFYRFVEQNLFLFGNISVSGVG